MVTVNPLPTAAITPSGPTTLCQGGSVTLTASGGASYLWSPGGDDNRGIMVSAGGTYTWRGRTPRVQKSAAESGDGQSAAGGGDHPDRT